MCSLVIYIILEDTHPPKENPLGNILIETTHEKTSPNRNHGRTQLSGASYCIQDRLRGPQKHGLDREGPKVADN